MRTMHDMARNSEEGMLIWLAEVAREKRAATGRRQAHFAAAADVDQATIARFEQAKGWPRKLEEVVAAYAELSGSSEFDLWREAVERWATQAASSNGTLSR